MRKSIELMPTESLENSVQSLTGVFNLTDVQTQLGPGRGWSCSYDPSTGIVINADPDQIRTSSGEVNDNHVLFVARHELQHAHDMLDPDWKYQPDLRKLSPSDSFFWNFVHDVTIDGRTVKDYAVYRQVAPEIYENLFEKKNISKEPKHIQFMQALRAQSVLKDKSFLKIDPGVQEAINQLENENGHNIPETLIHKGTSLKQRIDIATKYIKPVYDKFLEEEKENGKSEEELDKKAERANSAGDMTNPGGGEQENGDGGSDDQNEEKNEHPEENEKNETTGDGDDTDSDKEESKEKKDGGKQSKSIEEQIEEAVESYQTDEQKRKEEEEAKEQDGDKGKDSKNSDKDGNLLKRFGEKIMDALDKDDEEKPKNPGEQSDQQREQAERDQQEMAMLAGTIIQELHLGEADAKLYAQTLLENRQLIKQVAEIFKLLTKIDRMPSRTTHNRLALPEGDQLHTGRLPQAFIEGEANIPMDIWRGRERKAPKIVKHFNGLDVQLLIDASMSMNGAPAQNAAAMSLVLIEGLLLAQKQQQKEVRGKKPDVRIGSSVFSGSTEVVMPLSIEPNPHDRARTFTVTRQADQGSTNVCPGLEAIFRNAQKNPDRDVIGVVISDNMFGDDPQRLLRNKPKNCTLFNLSLGYDDEMGPAARTAIIHDTSRLPAELFAILKDYEKRFAYE